jgi:hypothetical protein
MVSYRHEADRGSIERKQSRLKHDPIKGSLCPAPNPCDTCLSDIALVWLEKLLAAAALLICAMVS